MLQRKQTVFLLLAVILTAVCMCLQIGSIVPEELGNAESEFYNLWILKGDGTRTFAVWPLFAVLLASCTIGLVTIFLYKNRPLQSALCLASILLIVGWYLSYGIYAYYFGGRFPEVSFRPTWVAALPLVALIGYILARRSIMADEKLVRSADRIR